MIQMQVPAPQWLQQTPQGLAYAQPAGAAVFTNTLRPNLLEGVGQHSPWSSMGGRAGDSPLLSLATTPQTSVAQNNVDPAWQQSLYIAPSAGPQAGPLMLVDAGIAQGENLTAINPSRWVIQTSPTGQKTATMVSANTMGVKRNDLAQTTSPSTSSARINTNPFREPPIDSQNPPKKPTPNTTTTPSGDGSDGGGVTYDDYGGGAVTGEPALRAYWEQKHKEEMAAQQAAMLAAEQQQKAAMSAAAAKAQAELSQPSWMPLILGGAVIAGLAWWATSGSSGSKKKEE